MYDSVHRDSLWCILRHFYHLPEKLLSIIRALHENSTAAVKTYGKTSDKFPVTCSVRQGCVLAPTLFNLYFDVAIHMALDEHRQEVKGIKLAYLHDAELVGNRKILKLESLVTDLEYADYVVLLADNWSDLTTMLDSLSTCCKKLGLTIRCKKTKILAVLPPNSPDALSPVLISTSCQEQSLLKWSPTFSTWVASSKMTVGWTRKSTPGSARPLLPSSHF